MPRKTLLLATAMLALSAYPILAAPPKGAAAPKSVEAPKVKAAPAQPYFVSDIAIQKIVDERLITYHESAGMVIGTIDATGIKIFAGGTLDAPDDPMVDSKTIFEIGSVTKIFTALLLEDMARRGELSLDDPAAKYLPPDAKLPEWNGHKISLMDLVTHTAGLPKGWAILPQPASDPAPDTTIKQIYRFLASYELTRDVGSQYEYSDLGYALLGEILMRITNKDFQTLVATRIAGPLGMDGTVVRAEGPLADRAAVGHDEHLKKVPYTPVGATPSVSGLRSTADDLLKLLSAAMGYTPSPLSPVLADMLAVKRTTRYAALKAAMGWHVATLHDKDIVWHNGVTDGFRSFVGYLPGARAGVVVLSNSHNNVDDIGVHLLDDGIPLKKLHREIAIDRDFLESYVGRYVVNDGPVINIIHDGDKLFIQPITQPRAEIFPESDRNFFLRDSDGQVRFDIGSDGRANSLTLFQNGQTAIAIRMHTN